MRLFTFGNNVFECEVENHDNGRPCGKVTNTIRLSLFESNALLENCGTVTGEKAASFIIRNAMGIAVCKDHIR